MIVLCEMAFRETRDYVEADDTNVIKAWLNSLPGKQRDKVKARLDILLHYIRSSAVVRDDWMEKLKGEDDGIYEIKLSHRNIAYRILSCYGPGPRQITMLFPATKHNDRLRPPGARNSARERSAHIHIAERTVPHDY